MKNLNNQELSILAQLAGLIVLTVLAVSFWGTQHIILEKFNTQPFTFLESLIIYSTLMIHIAVLRAATGGTNKFSDNIKND